MQTHKLWTKDFIFASLINFFLIIVMYLLMVTIGPFAADRFQANAGTAGLVSGSYIIGALMARFIAGPLVERIGNKKVLVAGTLLYVVSGATYFLAFNLPLLLLIRFIHGMGMGVGSTATGSIVARVLPPDRRGEGIGYYSLSGVLGAALGPFLGILLAKHLPFSMLFLFCTILALASFVLAITIKADEDLDSVHSQKEKESFSVWSFMEKNALPIGIVTLFVAIAYGGVLSFIMFYAEEVNLVTASSFFFLVYAITVLLSRPFTGKLLDLKGGNIVVMPALFLFAGGLVLLSESSTGAMLLGAGVLIGLGFGNFQSSAQALSVKVADPHKMGLATSTFFIFLDFGVGFGPYILGSLVPHVGYDGIFKLLAGVVLFAVLLYVALYGVREHRERNTA
ncbi:Predicted arabinose efflux permease, MFS family [Bhargavaea ginsengi]|uniref:Predicted arabinose efflux permease, MFS family n=1 Tax=Bhargavaea ginsengi TaxID=426757 RepID=A0A1H6XU93_9BACL|nr:MFS transporter [Bhargavaea ginsengi]MCM3086509.1 MFS transporter [Bhargavaea ginsengi]SEJ28462.1 Predicted arabinose efflux permease, MFS family [Bhargavaea ginsengi]